MYFNTVDEQGNTLEDYIRRAACQEAAVLHCFKLNAGRNLTAWDIQQMMFESDPEAYPVPIPITSVRRCITCLTKDNKIHKSEHRKKGAYDRLCYTWVYYPDAEQKEIEFNHYGATISPEAFFKG